MQFAMNMCCIPDWWTMERSYGWAKCPLESVVEHWHLYVISNGIHQWLAQVLTWTTRYKQRNHWRVGHCWLLLLKQFQQDNRLWNVMRQQPLARLETTMQFYPSQKSNKNRIPVNSFICWFKKYWNCLTFSTLFFLLIYHYPFLKRVILDTDMAILKITSTKACSAL